MATVRKENVAAKVADKLGVSRSQGHEALNAVLESVREALAMGDRVVLTGFGAFEARQMAERWVETIDGSRIAIAPHRRVRFKPGRDLTGGLRSINRRALARVFGSGALSQMEQLRVSTLGQEIQAKAMYEMVVLPVAENEITRHGTEYETLGQGS